MTSSATIGIVGSLITFSCSSDLDPVRIEWYRNNTLLSQRYATSDSITLGLISTDDEGAVYTCSAIGHYGSQERNKTLNVKGIILLLQWNLSIKDLRNKDTCLIRTLYCPYNVLHREQTNI